MGSGSPRHVEIDADLREPRSIHALLGEHGADVHVRLLKAGDYLVADGAIVERKTVNDLHLTLMEGRLWRQLGDLRTSARRRYLLIEGSNLYSGPLRPQAMRGAILTLLELGIHVLHSHSQEDSAGWLLQLARRLQQPRRTPDRPLYAQRPKPRPDQTAESILASVPGISTVSARALLRHFGSVAAVLSAGPEEWLAVPGIGRQRADSLSSAINRTHPAYRSRHGRERSDLAT